MKTIVMDKQIGASWWEDGITADFVRDELSNFNEEDNKLQLSIDSPGGSVWECISIFNIIRDFMREHPEVIVETYIQGMAASAASVIALAAKCENPKSKIIVEDNSVYMIHNAWSIVQGDHNEMDKQSDLLKKMDAVMARSYCQVTGKSEKEIKSMMDKETFLFGAEIVENGFADEIIETKAEKTEGAKQALFATVKMSVEKTMHELKKEAEKKSFDRCVAMLGNSEHRAPENTAAKANNEKEELPMTLEELKAKEPALYAEVMNAGIEEGVNKERSRVSAHLKMGEAAGCMDVAAGFIRDGKPVADDDVQATYFEKRVASAQNAARKDDNVNPIVTPDANAQEDKDAVIMAAFDKAVGGN